MPRWVAVLLVLYAGCAFTISGPDPDRPHNQAPRCDTGKGLVVLDGLAATTAGLIAIGLAGESEPALALLPAAVGALYVGGAVAGNRRANECRQAMDEHATWVAGGGSEPARPRFDHLGTDHVRDVPVVPPKREPVPPPAPANEPEQDEQAEAAAPPAPPIRQVQAPQQPQQPARGPAKKLPPPKPQPQQQEDNEWTDFWREVD